MSAPRIGLLRPAAWGIVLALAWGGAAVPVAAQGGASAVAEPEGYRMEAYRAPVPETLAGARVLSTAEAHALWDEGGAAFIDVLPSPPRPEGLPEGTIWRPEARDDIPGSIWLADTGYGALSPEAEAYFADGLRQASGGDLGATLVFYCKAECWMSWNAAKRARSMGYGEVVWYPEGTDGWAAAGHPLERREPLGREAGAGDG